MATDELDGLLLVDKPVGLTSAAVVAAVKRGLKLRKVGHLGTLDPFASGLLPLCLGEATKISRFLANEGKAYSGMIRLGTATDTLDCTGKVTDSRPVGRIDPKSLAIVRERFTGQLTQTPPMFSAVKQAGVPLYKLARRGLEVQRQPRVVLVRKLDLAIAAKDALGMFVECSKGTYVRVLAQEIGRALGTCGHLLSLRRTAFGRFHLGQAIELDSVSARVRNLPVLSAAEALIGHRRFVLDPRGLSEITRGRQEALARLDKPRCEGEIACLVDEAGVVFAIAEATRGLASWRVARVLAAASRLYNSPSAC